MSPAWATITDKGQEEIERMYDISKGDGWNIEIKSKCVINGINYATICIMGPDGKDHGALMAIYSIPERLFKGVPTY